MEGTAPISSDFSGPQAQPAESENVAPPGSTLLEVQNATVQFGKFLAVRNVSFALRAGSLLGLIGPNGAGKTTLLRAIASIQRMAAGQIRILGETVRPGDEQAARMIGFNPDVPPAYDALSIRQFLAFIAAGYGLTAENTDPTIDFWLEKVWLADKKNQKVRSLSRGMKQRLGLARTLLPNPNIILLDEPAAGLDPAGRVQFRKLLTDLRDQGKAIVVSSHILSDMEDYCTHIAIMSHGAVLQFGTVREISAGADDGRCRYAVTLAQPIAGLQETLAEIPGILAIQVDRLAVTFEYHSETEKAAWLLRELIRREIPVAAFQSQKADLEEAYMRSGVRQVD